MNLDEELCRTVRNGRLEVVKFLVEKGANIHICEDYPLRCAAKYGHLEIIRYLTENGADVHALNLKEELGNALYNGRLEVVKFLVEKGVDIHANEDYALCWVSSWGKLKAVKYLVENGSNIHARENEALRWAAYNGCLEVVKYLVEKGANIHACKDAALHCAIDSGHLKVAKYLIDHGAYIHTCKDYVFNKRLEIIKYLMKKDCNIKAWKAWAFRYANNKINLKTIKCLFKKGYSIWWLHQTILRSLAYWRHLGVIKYLELKNKSNKHNKRNKPNKFCK